MENSIKIFVLLLFGICSGGLVAAGVYSFITILGLIPRLAARSHTARYVKQYENAIIAGSFAGNTISLFPMSWQIPSAVGIVVLTIWGICTGIFTGCLAMSLAETMNTIPVMNRRIHLATGMPYLIMAIALGKTVGALLYFIYRLS
jgi:stage V sporulation protein AB